MLPLSREDSQDRKGRYDNRRGSGSERSQHWSSINFAGTFFLLRGESGGVNGDRRKAMMEISRY